MKEKWQYEHFPYWQIDISSPHKASPCGYSIRLPVRLWEGMKHFWNAKQLVLPLAWALFHTFSGSFQLPVFWFLPPKDELRVSVFSLTKLLLAAIKNSTHTAGTGAAPPVFPLTKLKAAKVKFRRWDLPKRPCQHWLEPQNTVCQAGTWSFKLILASHLEITVGPGWLPTRFLLSVQSDRRLL